MKRQIIGIVLFGSLGIVASLKIGIAVHPFHFLMEKPNEQLSRDVAGTTVAQGTFFHPELRELVAWEKGDVEILRDANGKSYVYLMDNFDVGRGPQFHVYLVDRPVKDRYDFLSANTIDLGHLKAFKGSQVYTVAANANLDEVKSVVIWCEEFGVLVSPANLGKATPNISTASRGRSKRLAISDVRSH